jgi:hypothetical protein
MVFLIHENLKICKYLHFQSINMCDSSSRYQFLVNIPVLKSNFSNLCECINATNHCFGPLMVATNLLKLFDVVASSFLVIIGILDMEPGFHNIRLAMTVGTFLFDCFFISHMLFFCYKCSSTIQEVSDFSYLLL